MSSAFLDLSSRGSEAVRISEVQLEDLASRCGGTLLRSGDSGWDEAVLIWNGMPARVPGLVLRPNSVQDVVTAVRFARDHGLQLGVKGGGHNIAGTAIADGGLTLDMSGMRHVTVEPEARRAHAAAGCRLGDVDAATQKHGLATVLGFISEVGVAGLTLGGGLGYLTRRFGWTVDNLEEVEIVTADGQIRIANRTLNPDLFWAIRGGGGNFGVVTRFTYRLHEVGPQVFGGLIAWPFDRADEVLQAYRSLTSEAPRELAVWLICLNAPPAPFVPDAWKGERVCAMAVCFSGNLADVNQALAPIRGLNDSVFDLLAEQPYVQLQSYLDHTEPKGEHYYWKTEYLDGLRDGLLSTVRDISARCPIPEAQIGILHLEGALNERPVDDGAVGNRDVRYVVGVLGAWAPDEPQAPQFRRWVREAGEQLRPFSTGSNYVNFQTEDEGIERIRATYGPNFNRLVEAKRMYDPENVFSCNRNIQPSIETVV